MKKKVGPLLGVAIALFVVQALMHDLLIRDRWVKNYYPAREKDFISQTLSPDQIMLQLFGFREFLAGILWVRADSFFDQGNYDAVLPLIRLCTILDPKQIDIYSTGMWHIAYNFTDEEQRSDRRYIPEALALGKEGTRQNPSTYELFFETGWIWYHKIQDDFEKPIYWWVEAQKRSDMIPARKNILANAYQRNNQVQEALDHYFKLHDIAMKRFKEQPDYESFNQAETLENNIDNVIVRMVQRGWVAKNKGYYEQGDYDTKPPHDVQFSARVTVEDQRVLRIDGTWNVLPVGTRIRVVLRDADFPNAVPAGMEWDYKDEVQLDPDRKTTFLQDELFVKDRRFTRKIDMSRDPTMYPCLAKNYVIEFFYSPQVAPPHIQDKFGWDGTGMTDSNFLNTEVRPGQRVVFTTMELTKEQLLRRGEWTDRTPVLMTKNFDPAKISTTEDEIIMIPSLRGSEATRGGDE